MLALADDLTGALEVGAKFAQSGVSSIVTTYALNAATPPGALSVIDMETRHLLPEQAAARVSSVLPTVAPRLIYLKTDSTLRGNIRVELTVLSKFLASSRIAYIPWDPLESTCRHASLSIL